MIAGAVGYAGYRSYG